MLNVSQLECINKLTNFILSTEKYFLLTGEAGAGKSYLIKYFIKNCIKLRGLTFKILAPTNKALDVLKEFMPEYKNSCMTIAKYYNYKQVITETGIKKSEYTLKYKKEQILIFDESSMINRDIFECLKNQRCKMIFIGDRQQLPPVEEDQSKIYTIENIQTFNLTINERQKDTEKHLVMFINELRENVNLNNFDFNKVIRFLTNDKHIFMNKAIEKIKEDDSTVILTFTRAKAEYYNKIARSAIFDKPAEELDKFYLNEYVVFTESVYMSNFRKNYSSGIKYQIKHLKPVLLHVNLPYCMCKRPNEFISKVFNDIKKEKCVNCCTPTSLKGMKEIKFYEIKLGTDTEIYYVPYDNDELEKYNVVIRKYKDRCISQRNARTWKLYYDIDNMYNLPISYRYSITCHKSQGSSYLNTFVDIQNIRQSCYDDTQLRNRLIYTGASRVKEYLLCLI